jgi:hypothetical protein
MKKPIEFEYLSNFVGGYFHQDWTIGASSANDVIDRFLQDATLEGVQGVVGDIDRLLITKASETDLENTLRTLGSAYYFKADGFSASQWLQHIRTRLSAILEPSRGTRLQ